MKKKYEPMVRFCKRSSINSDRSCGQITEMKMGYEFRLKEWSEKGIERGSERLNK